MQAELDTRAAEADALRRQAVERARHRADLARRRYLAVDPDNRLVADSLEADWNDALRALQAAREDYERASARPRQPPSPTRSRTESIHWQQISPPSGPTRTPRSGTANAWSVCSSTTSPCTRPTASTCTCACAAGRPAASPSRSRPHPGRPAKPAPTPSKRSTGSSNTHTDAEAAEALNAAGHRSGENKPFTAGIVVHVRRKYHLPSHAERLRAHGLLTTTELAQHLDVHPSTVKSWTKAGILNSHKANDKNERLYQPPTADDPRLTTRQGSPLRKRVPTQPTTGGAL